MNLDWLGIVLRWTHILAACAAVGGTMFMRLALLPSLDSISDDARKTLHEAIRVRWGQVVKLSIALLLFSGLWNFINMNSQYDLRKVGYYQMLFGIKFLLALGVFFISSVLTGKSKDLEPMQAHRKFLLMLNLRFWLAVLLPRAIRAKRKFWLTLNLALLIVIVCISGVLRMAEKPKKFAWHADPPAISAVWQV